MAKFNLLTASALATFAFVSQGLAHGPVEETFNLGVIGAGQTGEETVHCPHHHWVVSGGVVGGERLAPNGPLEVTGSYPSSTRAWTVQVTNGSGRPTGAQEASITVRALCGSHPWH